MPEYDFIAIGGGSAGFNAARVAAGLGRKVAVVDGARELGGLCILRGCMPSKTLLHAAETLHRARHAAVFGVRVKDARIDPRAMRERKRRVIAEFAGYRERQLRSGPFKLYRSRARFLDPRTVILDDGRRLRARRFLVATGSRVALPPVPGLAEIGAWSSDDVLDIGFVPRSVIVLGGGVVACELAQFLGRIGARVTLVQRSPQLLREHSPQAAAALQRAFADEGIEVLTGTALRRLSRSPRGVTAEFLHRGRILRRRADHCLNALGRVPATAGLGLEAAGVRLRPDGRIRANRWQQTTASHIYAAGDCAGPDEIVHLAVQQGELAARHAFGKKGLHPVDRSLLLQVVFTDPAVASVGLGERELKAKGRRFLQASYPFDDHGKSILMEARYGFAKVLAEPRRGRLLGAEIVGREAGELIHCLSGPLALGATAAELLRAPWYHPTLAEIVTYPLEEIAEAI